MDMLVATDFFIAEVWTSCGLVTYYVLFFIHLASRRVHVAGMTPHPDQRWMVQIARNVTMVDWGFLVMHPSCQAAANGVPWLRSS
jgi:putative transposase